MALVAKSLLTCCSIEPGAWLAISLSQGAITDSRDKNLQKTRYAPSPGDIHAARPSGAD
jgi:hypothetical protein